MAYIKLRDILGNSGHFYTVGAPDADNSDNLPRWNAPLVLDSPKKGYTDKILYIKPDNKLRIMQPNYSMPDNVRPKVPFRYD